MKVLVDTTSLRTPAQAYGHPNFVTDVPVQGPTDEGLRSADCIQQNRLPAHPGCVDCGGGLIPMWAQQSTSLVRGNSAGYVAGLAGLGERISFGGRGALGFALAGDEIWTKLTPDQQMWVSTSLNTLNSKIVAATGTQCPTWGPAINLAGGCFQTWYNANYGASGASKKIRQDGVFDEDTLCALIMIAQLKGKGDFPTPFPDPSGKYCAAPTPVAAQKKVSTAKMLGFGALAAAGIGAVAYAATHSKGRRRRRR